MKENADFKTLCVHAGELKDEQYGGAISPLYMSSSYAFNDVETNQYPRYFNTPNQRGLAIKIAALEGAEAGMIFGSGMAAISTALLSHLKSGDHVIFQDDLYGGTRNFIKHEFPKYGIQYSFTAGLTATDFENEIQDNTKGIYIETPSNPTLKIIDLQSVSTLAKKTDLWTMIDNTFASPVNQNPIAFGIDVVLHSATKYLGGHSDICAGAVLGSQKAIDRVFESAKNFGGSLSDYTVWLLERSIKTLFLRVQAQNQNAQLLAEFLADQDWIDNVYYPGLPQHPDHEIAKQQMKGFGGMLTFDLAPHLDCKQFLLGLKLIKPTMSLAGIESTALSPRLTSHALLTETERIAQGITPQMVRFSTGIEAIEDLKEDLIQSVNQQH
ncbi:PLP-dependent aspartate aminotransferase family protein [Flavobacteriaceae bacterium]|jgi:cystathionine beta-lyase/cystathionine gamma-synthase|nr:PLP-dependent aspartate aminotransferase family protein [Flavobacteriaceae bacterium]MDC0917005.1 PLP-dependent aspartate aminotransferase family protein [Flavobacteriaceae bacterium]MDC3330474.1 PLP-dependent aspartate aminotransferase family protein [Flavobacteriaceae bacterium]